MQGHQEQIVALVEAQQRGPQQRPPAQVEGPAGLLRGPLQDHGLALLRRQIAQVV
jgi:hypothetical protein